MCWFICVCLNVKGKKMCGKIISKGAVYRLSYGLYGVVVVGEN